MLSWLSYRIYRVYMVPVYTVPVPVRGYKEYLVYLVEVGQVRVRTYEVVYNFNIKKIGNMYQVYIIQ